MSFQKPTSGTLIQRFGADFQKPDGSWYYKSMGYQGHNGDDYAVPIGTPVYAADDGTVIFEGWGQKHPWMLAPAGICVLINHGGSYGGYAHMNSTVVSEGQRVTKGQKIGYSGQTGAATGPHLHFEMIPLQPNWQNGYAARVDPMPYMDAPSNNATVDQINQAYREILERPNGADADGLSHYQNYSIDFVRSDLASSQEYRDLQARKAADSAAKQAAQQEADRQAALAAEQARQAAADAAAKAAAEAANAQPGKGSVGPETATSEPPHTDPFITQPNPPQTAPETTPATPQPAKPNAIVRILFELAMRIKTILTKKA